MLAAYLVALLTGVTPQTGKLAFDPAWILEASTPTYGPDGSISGATARFGPGTAGQPLTFYPASGKSLCASASATTDAPSDAGNGWRVTVTPLASAGSKLRLRVEWVRLWEGGVKLANGPHGVADVTIGPGDRVPFDYIPASNRDAQDKCDAIGMGLELGLKPIPSNVIVEANLWLVRTLANGSETSQRQTLRVRVGSRVEYFFDDVAAPGAPVKDGNAYYFNAPLRTQGALSGISVENGKVRLDLEIAQYAVLGSRGRGNGGSATFPVDAGPDEVLSFRVPRTGGEQLALRIQIKQLR